MRTFLDTARRTWSLSVNVESIKRVRARANVDLLQAADGDLLAKLAGDPVMLVDVLFALCEPEAKILNVSDIDFGQAFSGDVLDSATAALLEEIVDFFPKSRRELMRTAVAKLTRVQVVAAQRLGSRLDELSPEAIVDKLIAELDAKTGSNSVTSSPELSGSIPAH